MITARIQFLTLIFHFMENTSKQETRANLFCGQQTDLISGHFQIYHTKRRRISKGRALDKYRRLYVPMHALNLVKKSL